MSGPSTAPDPVPEELVRRALRARRSEFSELFDPAIRLDLSERVFNPDVYEGYDGLMRWRSDLREVWESYDSEVERLFDRENATVVVIHERGRGKGSGVDVDRRYTLLFRLARGRVREMRLYADLDRALRDAGA
jgi:hypothetical protein